MGVTIREIAEKAGVSSITVSRVLNGNPGNKVSAGLSAEIRELAKRMGYSRNAFASAIRTGKIPLIAVCLHRLWEDERYIRMYWCDMVSNFTTLLPGYGLDMILVAYTEPAELKKRLTALSSSGLIGGVISNLIPDAVDECCEAIAAAELPFVLLGNPVREDIPCVYSDNTRMQQHLAKLMGPKNCRVLKNYHSRSRNFIPEDFNDPAVFIAVDCEKDRMELIREHKVEPHRIVLMVNSAVQIFNSSGYVINTRSKERCINCIEILSELMAGRRPVNIQRKIELSEKDLTFVAID